MARAGNLKKRHNHSTGTESWLPGLEPGWRRTVEPKEEKFGRTLIGEAAHIHGASSGTDTRQPSARYVPNMTDEEAVGYIKRNLVMQQLPHNDRCR
jgi:hypothetical protein